MNTTAATEKEKSIAVVSFTAAGQKQAERIKEVLDRTKENENWNVVSAHKPKPLQEWCREQFASRDALLFIGAMGIAVRTIAPYLQSKLTDPAVLVMDEQAKHVISVLSGHVGGGNELTCFLAEKLGADAVITTASDVNNKIAIDVFAKKNGLVISDRKMAVKAAVAIVEGKKVSFSCGGKVSGMIPKEISANRDEAEFHIEVSPLSAEGRQGTGLKRDSAAGVAHPPILQLIPKAYVLGIGCRRGKTAEEIEARVLEELNREGILPESISEVATIDLKKEEAGLLMFCEKYGLPLICYTAEELKQAPGEYVPSEFVADVTGVDNVCERAAVLRAWEDCAEKEREEEMPFAASHVAIKKSGKDGITVALAKREWSVGFE